MKQDGAESTLDLLTNIPINWNLIKMTLSTKNILAFNGLLSTWLNFRLPPFQEISPNLRPEDRYIPGGFVETARTNSPVRDDELAPYYATIHPVQLKYLNKIIKDFKAKKVEIVLVTTPVSVQYLNSIANYGDWKQVIVELAANHNVPYMDFNDYKYLTSSDFFYDIDHLNSVGVKEFNKELYNRLSSLPGFQMIMGKNTLSNTPFED
jgi:hypothetical protein